MSDFLPLAFLALEIPKCRHYIVHALPKTYPYSTIAEVNINFANNVQNAATFLQLLCKIHRNFQTWYTCKLEKTGGFCTSDDNKRWTILELIIKIKHCTFSNGNWAMFQYLGFKDGALPIRILKTGYEWRF